MKQFFIIFGLVLVYNAAFSQFNWETQFGYSNLKHSQMNGISFVNNLRYHVGKKSSFFAGGSLNYAEGNRNVAIAPEQDHLSSFPFDYWENFEVKTSTSYQVSGTLGYGYDINFGKHLSVTLDGGVFLTYVNKTYIADIIEDVQMIDIFSRSEMEQDIMIPFYLRYYDVGTFLRGSLIVYKGKKVSIGASAAYYFPSGSEHWLDAGLLLKFKI